MAQREQKESENSSVRGGITDGMNLLRVLHVSVSLAVAIYLVVSIKLDLYPPEESDQLIGMVVTQFMVTAAFVYLEILHHRSVPNTEEADS